MDLFKKTVSLCCALCCALLCACSSGVYTGNVPDPETVPKSQQPDEAARVPFADLTGEEIMSDFPAEDFGGYKFNIFTSALNRFVPEEEAAGMLNPVIKERNDLLEERYNVKIAEVYCKESEFLSRLNTSVSAGRQFADAVSFSRNNISAAAASELLMNLYSVPYLQTDMAYLDSEMVRKSTIKNELYVIYEPSSLYYADLMCVAYNRKLVNEENGTVYSLVKENKWDSAAMLALAEEAAAEVMGKRSPDIARDTFGIVSLFDRSELLHESFVSSGYALFGDTFHKEIEYNADLATADVIAANAASLFGSKCVMNSDPDTAAKAFREGRAAFAVCRLGFITSLEGASLDWGLAPFPLMYPGQDGYHSCISDTACGLSVPECQREPSRTGKIMTLLIASSYAGPQEALLKNLMTFTLLDNASALVMRRVFESPVTDISLLYFEGEGRFSGLGRGTVLDAVNTGKSFEELVNANIIALRELNALDFR